MTLLLPQPDPNRSACDGGTGRPRSVWWLIWPRTGLLHAGVSWLLIVWLVVSFTGCASESARLIDSPLGIQEQTTQILEIVPLGTTRRDALDRLQANGVDVTPGAADSVLYCSIWNRKNGERWTMNVALLFDEQGRLYAARPAEADVALETSELSRAATTEPTGTRARTATAAPQPSGPAADPQSTSRGARPRVPFGSP